MAKRLNKSGKNFIILICLVVLLCGFTFWQIIKAPVNLAEKVTITIPSGSASSQIGSILAENGLIKSEFAFNLYVQSKNISDKLKQGSYTFEPGKLSLKNVANALVAGGESENVVWVTIPEGLTVLQTAELLAEKGLVDQEAFLTYCAEGDFPYDYIPEKGDYTRLEGFVSPNTYQFDNRWTEEQIVNMFLDQFDRTFTKEWREEVARTGRSIYEVVIMASIIEREAKVESDRPIISGVFYNRLAIPMRLESCATVQYALGEVKEVLTYKDLEIDSPYNTYTHDGMPPGPIAAPGLSSLEAAVYPEKTDYLFFLAKPDGSHYFSKTLAEHNAAREKYLK